jgi:aspartate aminotransferase-like enzyme
MIQKPRLFTPGPTPPLHPAVLEAMARPIPHHRTDEFRKVFAESITGLKTFLKTTEDVLILACSGTGGMEAALVNVLRRATRCWPWSRVPRRALVRARQGVRDER